MENRLADLRRFYELLDRLGDRLGGARTLDRCHGRLSWPTRGVYFFFESGEVRVESGTGLRVVRVGTHALKKGSRSTLWGRLAQHRGNLNSEGGNHRSSIFRLHTGKALTNRCAELACETWGRGHTATATVREAERHLEAAVSHAIRQMPFLWLAVQDEAGPASLRGYIERNAIGLLSNVAKQPIDPPSSNWLGHYSDREAVRLSGLWNVNHVSEPCDPSFLDRLERLVDD